MQLGQVLSKTVAAKTRGDARPKLRKRRSFILQGIAQDVARLLLHAASVPGRSALKLLFHFIFQAANHELAHTDTPDITISFRLPLFKGRSLSHHAYIARAQGFAGPIRLPADLQELRQNHSGSNLARRADSDISDALATPQDR
jgi:hypothetical protein